MKTIEINILKFDELSEDAKQVAIRDYINKDMISTDFIYDDAHNTVKAFNELFGTKEGSISWLDFSTSHIDDNVLNLKGQRLRTYIINNFGHKLFSGKYYGTLTTDKEGKSVHKKRYSKVIKNTSCVLTGVCYDDDMLQPMYEFINGKLRPDYDKDQDFSNLINDCFKSLERSIENEVNYMNSEEGIIEEIISRDLEFTENGKIYL